MAKKIITESVYVTIRSTPEEIMQTVVGGSILPISKLFDRYRKSKESYEKDDYTIIKEDTEKHSFIAEKIYEEDDIND